MYNALTDRQTDRQTDLFAPCNRLFYDTKKAITVG